MKSLVLGALALTLFAPAAAKVVSTSPGAFSLLVEQPVRATPAEAWAVLIDLPRWWDGAHSYSSDASRLVLEPRAGGCWCERWSNGRSVEHARVVMVLPPATLRLVGGLGPLQEIPANAVMTFSITKSPEGSTVRLDYRVASAAGGLDKLAAPVDTVLTGQLERLGQAIASASTTR